MVTRWPPLVLLTVSCKLSAELRCKLRYQDVCQGNLALITFPSGSVARPWLLYTSYLFQNQQSLWRPLILRCTVPLCCPVKTILQKNLTRIKKLFYLLVVQFSIKVNIALIQNIQLLWNALHGVWWSKHLQSIDISLISHWYLTVCMVECIEPLTKY